MSGKRKKQNHLPPSQSVSLGRPKPADIAQIQEVHYAGPLPPPHLLAQYNQLIPNGAERIMAMAERQSTHREKLEEQVVNGNVTNQTRGSWFAFILALVSILGGVFLIYEGKSVAGLVEILASVGGLVGVFLYSKHEQKKERNEKAAALHSLRSQ